MSKYYYTGKKMPIAKATKLLADVRGVDGVAPTWTYIRTNRRDLIDAYATLHPNHPSIKKLREMRSRKEN